MNGVIKKVVKDKGFGFISPEDHGKDVFFHVSDVVEGIDFMKMEAGDPVKYDTAETSKGTKAIGVCYA